MWLIVGLGNPGVKYSQTRHNIGFMAVDALFAHYSRSLWGKKCKGEMSEINLAGTSAASEKIYLLKPQTFMNLSGESVLAATTFYKISPEQIIVMYDDVDLAIGKLRVRQGGGNGGHNGLKSMDANIGKNYWRVRLGVGRPPDYMETADYVLGKFTPEEKIVQQQIIAGVTQYIFLLLENNAASFMNKIALEMGK